MRISSTEVDIRTRFLSSLGCDKQDSDVGMCTVRDRLVYYGSGLVGLEILEFMRRIQAGHHAATPSPALVAPLPSEDLIGYSDPPGELPTECTAIPKDEPHPATAAARPEIQQRMPIMAR